MDAISNSILLLAEFAAGYLVILLTPGPNLFAIAGLASAHGIRATLPFCFGLALGAGSLCALMGLPVEADLRLDSLMRLVGSALLLWLASGIARGQARETVQTHSRTAVAWGGGFATAVTNPISAAYFLSAALQAGKGPMLRLSAPLVVVLTASAVYLVVAGTLATPAARRAALAWDRPIRIVAATVVTVMAGRLVWPLVAW